MRQSIEAVLAAVKKSGAALEFADSELQADHRVCLSALRSERHGGQALEFVQDQNIKSDVQMVLDAVTDFGGAVKFCSEEVWSERAVVLAALKNLHVKRHRARKKGTDLEVHGSTWENILSPELRGDKEVVLFAPTCFCELLAQQRVMALFSCSLFRALQTGENVEYSILCVVSTDSRTRDAIAVTAKKSGVTWIFLRTAVQLISRETGFGNGTKNCK